MGLLHRRLGRVEHAGRGVLASDLAPIASLGDLVDVGAGGVHRDVHVRDLGLHQLEVPDAATELLALLQIGHDLVQAGGHDADADAGQDDPLVVQTGHEDLHPPPLFAQDVLEGDLDILEDQFPGVRAAHPELVEVGGRAEARHRLLDQEGRDALRAGVGIGLGVDDQDVRVRPVGDPVLRAVQDIAVVPLIGAQLHRDDVRARGRLGHSEGSDVLAADQLREVAVSLLVRPVQLDLVHAEVRVRAVGQRDGS